MEALAGTFRQKLGNAILAGVLVAMALGLVSCGGSGSSQTQAPASPHKARTTAGLAPDLGTHHHKITTSNPEAQKAFDRGLILAFAFSHGTAEKAFRQAAELDPQCAMAWWGVALVNGPHINFPMVPPDKAKTAWEALARARELAPGASQTEQALIGALGKRYANPQPEDRAPLDRAYAEAMREVWKAHPKDPDVAVLFSEAMMDLRPWDLWTHDGKPQPGTEEIQATLEQALVLDPDHPGANHLYIHVVEASPQPEKGITAADRLRDLVPGASHLVHMPAHIYARVGRWDDAATANVKAMEADKAFRAANPKPGLYAMYMAHNNHFFAYAAEMQGRSADALKSAREMVAAIPPEFLRDYGPIADGFMVFVPEVLMRFGRWEEVLAEPAPPANLPLATAMWHFTRAVSFTALGRTEEAKKEREVFHKAAAAVPKDSTFGNNSSADILAIATKMLDGEMAAKQDKFDESVKLLGEAVKVEDGLRYDEPPGWMQPVRHTLGAVLLRAGRYAEAERVYREDLAQYPENGWSLFGLARALRMQKKDAEAAAVEARFEKAWAKADVKLSATCFCQQGV